MSRTYQTYTYELAPGLLLTVDLISKGYWEQGKYFEDDAEVQAATLTPFGGEPINLLEGLPYARDPLCWLEETCPDKGRLIDRCLEKGRVSEKAIPESEAA